MYKGYRYVDSDAHILEPTDLWQRYLEPEFRSDAPQHLAGYENDPPTWVLDIHIGEHTMPDFETPRGMQVPGIEEAYGEYAREGFTAETYRRVLDRSGIDYMVVYPTVGLYTVNVPDLSAATAAAYRRAYNNWLYDFCSAGDGRVLGVGSVDLRDPTMAAEEARRCVKELGFKAIHVNPEPIDEHALHDPCYDLLWAEIASLDVPVGAHPAGGTAFKQVGRDYFRDWVIGRAICSFTMGAQLACLSFIAGGILERHPTLRVVFLESGAGWVPFWLDRMHAGVAGGSRRFGLGLQLHPVEYFQRQCYISADPDDPGIVSVIREIGDGNIVTATDFGHLEGQGYTHAIEDTLALEGVTDDNKRKIMWDNAVRLYSLKDSA
jgi:predicted TIM-barrel fold metal-dependent hydrolase